LAAHAKTQPRTAALVKSTFRGKKKESRFVLLR